jgi:DNA polymerase V
MAVLDDVNHRLGPDTLRYAASGMDRPWHMRREHTSPNYTTRWDELPTVRAG